MISNYKDLTRDQIDSIIYMYINEPCTIAEIARSEHVTENLVMEVLDKHNVY